MTDMSRAVLMVDKMASMRAVMMVDMMVVLMVVMKDD